MDTILANELKTAPASIVGPFEEIFPETVIIRLIKKYSVPKEEMSAFTDSLREAYAEFVSERHLMAVRSCHMASKEDAKTLFRKLRSTIREIEAPPMRARLDTVTPIDPLYLGLAPRYRQIRQSILPYLHDPTKRPPPNSSIAAGQEFLAYLPEEHWTTLLPHVRSLLKILEEATKLDGNAISTQRRIKYDFRASARPLHEFWTKRLKRPGSIVDRASRQTVALKFLLDCLRVLDPKVKEASLRGLATLSNSVNQRTRQATPNS